MILVSSSKNAINFRSVIKEQVLQSKQMGRRENKHVNFEGRVPFDLLLVSSKDLKRNYNLFVALYINVVFKYFSLLWFR